MTFLFSNRGAAFKVLVALGLLVGMGHDLDRRLCRLRPDAASLKEAPERYDGVQVWLQHARVERPEKDGFTAYLEPVRIQVLSGAVHVPLTDGSRVTVRGTYHRNGYLKAEAIQVFPQYRWRRAAIYAYSMVALGVLIWLMSRSFRLRPPLLAPTESHGA